MDFTAECPPAPHPCGGGAVIHFSTSTTDVISTPVCCRHPLQHINDRCFHPCLLRLPPHPKSPVSKQGGQAYTHTLHRTGAGNMHHQTDTAPRASRSLLTDPVLLAAVMRERIVCVHGYRDTASYLCTIPFSATCVPMETLETMAPSPASCGGWPRRVAHGAYRCTRCTCTSGHRMGWSGDQLGQDSLLMSCSGEGDTVSAFVWNDV
jgi:hypothetical protein